MIFVAEGKGAREMNKMELCWNYCDRCDAKIKVGDICYYVGEDDTYCEKCCRRVDTAEEYEKRFGERSENGK